ncbi:oxidative stress defense protein [Vibrio sagamiensis]|uniref:Oxidative stress defense protein n=1 Tax=Vibrio sagamiensis NBRC 104589 TaxID=1219064 RepID=A0A511QJ10_9VIBR|nr:oxidative stress defense protein [Vibrio sagamiensis]PNQ59680.1 oxidative stress defense protein [Vibrio agarivorans]GEM76442.1 oxidative stress defense protein [Vibrio sagamiensis NBRC 104589]
MKWFSSLFVTVLSMCCVSVYADDGLNFPHVITTGYGEVSAKPDMATFSVKVVETTLTAEQAKQSVDDVVNSFLKSLEDIGISKSNISSSNLYISPQYHYPKSGSSELVGYRASRTVDVVVIELAKLNQYLDMALKSGINQVDNIQLKVSEQKKYQQKARLAAIKDAKNKAIFLAEGFEKQLGDVWLINDDRVPPLPVLTRSMMMDTEQSSNGYQDSKLIIRDQIDVIYKLK